MNKEVVDRAVHHGNGHKSANREIAEFFDEVAAAGVQERLRTVSGSCRFDIAGAGTYRVDVKDGVPTVTHDAHDSAPADCIVALSAQDFLRILRREGNLTTFAAFLQGRMAISGDVSLAATLLFSYTGKPVGLQVR
jgi:putative sterol carrier protein